MERPKATQVWCPWQLQAHGTLIDRSIFPDGPHSLTKWNGGNKSIIIVVVQLTSIDYRFQ